MKRLIPFLAAIIAVAVPSVASAHTASASLDCAVPHPILTVDLADYQGAHVAISIDGVLVVSQDFASGFHTTRNAGSPAVNHVAKVVVTAADGPTYDHTFDLVAPACVIVHHQKVRPHAFLEGPCGDPMYRFAFDNSQSSVPVTFRVSYTAYSSHAVRTFHVTMPAHDVAVTPLHHVLGSTRMTIRAAGRLLLSKVSAPGGSYGKCSEVTRE